MRSDRHAGLSPGRLSSNAMPRTRQDPELARIIGTRVRELRVASGITQEQLAWDCDLDRAYIGHIEAGRRLPSLPVLVLIAKRLDGDLLDIVAAAVSPERRALVYHDPKDDPLPGQQPGLQGRR